MGKENTKGMGITDMPCTSEEEDLLEISRVEPSIIRLQEKVIITLFIIWIMSTDNPMPEGLVEMYIREP